MNAFRKTQVLVDGGIGGIEIVAAVGRDGVTLTGTVTCSNGFVNLLDGPFEKELLSWDHIESCDYDLVTAAARSMQEKIERIVGEEKRKACRK